MCPCSTSCHYASPRHPDTRDYADQHATLLEASTSLQMFRSGSHANNLLLAQNPVPRVLPTFCQAHGPNRTSNRNFYGAPTYLGHDLGIRSGVVNLTRVSGPHQFQINPRFRFYPFRTSVPSYHCAPCFNHFLLLADKHL
jgi:hypothetical protein